MATELHHIQKAFGSFKALDDVSLHIPEGELLALLGPSGSGKTTLLRVLGGVDLPDGGTILENGLDLTTLPARERNVGLVFQHFALFPHLDVRDNVAFALKVRKRPKDEIEQRVNELLELVQLKGMSHRRPSELSGGQRQRVALARALAARPRILLLDEPFSALDAKVRKELRRWLRALHNELGTTTVFVTHDQEEAHRASGHARGSLRCASRAVCAGLLGRRLVDPRGWPGSGRTPSGCDAASGGHGHYAGLARDRGPHPSERPQCAR